jgi:hypothetical protein
VIKAEVTPENLADLAAAIRYEDDGRAMRKELLQNLRKATKPALVGAKASIMSMPSTGLRSVGGSMRSAIAREIKQETKLTGHAAKVKIKVKRSTVRGLKDPAKRFNSTKSWRHPVKPFRRTPNGVVAVPRPEWTWVSQRSRKPGWFDNEMKKHHAEYRAAVQAAMDKAAERIARNTK